MRVCTCTRGLITIVHPSILESCNCNLPMRTLHIIARSFKVCNAYTREVDNLRVDFRNYFALNSTSKLSNIRFE